MKNKYSDSYDLSVLPEWMRPLFPAFTGTQMFSYDTAKKKYVVTFSDNDEVREYDSMKEAYYDKGYDYLYKSFDKTLPEYQDKESHFFEQSDDDIYILLGERENGSSPVFVASKDTTYVDTIREALEDFKKTEENYLNNVDSFGAAYIYLRDHPAFWTTSKEGDLKYLSWDTDGGIAACRIEAYLDDKSKEDFKMKFFSEPGGRVLPDAWHHYGDDRLMAYGSSYEEVVINTAAKVYEYFDSEGNHRQGDN